MEVLCFAVCVSLLIFMFSNSTNALLPFPVWVKDKETAHQFEAKVCPQRCNGTDIVNADAGHCVKCFPCTCYEGCEKEGTCCSSLSDGWIPPPLNRSQCVPDLGAFDEHLLQVIACDPEFPRGPDRRLCESRTFPRTRSTALPVTSTADNVTYANVHCAICNYDGQDVVEWNVTCRHNQFLYNATNNTQYDERAIQMPDVCGFQPGMSAQYLSRCDPRWYSSDVISTCNVTGQWAEQDEDIQKLCETVDRSKGYYVMNTYRSSERMYANVFCAMCNGELGGSSFCFRPPGSVLTSTSMVYFPDTRNNINSRTAPHCAKDQWTHPQGECRKLQCAAGKELKENICITAVRRVRGLGYHLSILLLPVSLKANSNTSPKDYARALRNVIYKKLNPITDFSVNITTAVLSELVCDFSDDSCQSRFDDLLTMPDDVRNSTSVIQPASSESKFLRAQIQADILARMSEDRDRFEERVLQRVFKKKWTVRLKMWTVVLKAFDMTSDLQQGGKTLSHLAMYGTSNVDRKSFPYTYSGRALIGLESYFVPLGQRLMCPHLSFQKDDFRLDVPCDDCDVQVRFPNFLDSDLKPVSFRVKLYPGGAWLTVDGQLVMCLDTFRDVFPDKVTMRSVAAQQNVSKAREIVTIVCGSVSVACLALTFLTYALFGQLRSLPGLNNMGLSLSLAAAQLSQLLPWGRDRKEAWCRVVGVATHWVWLVALGWMGVCCVHMARVFTAKTQLMRGHQRNREVRHAFLRNVLTTVLLSSLTVALVAALCLLASGGSSPGYGGPQCFLDTGLHRLLPLAFVLPLGLVLVTNITCFVVTVVAIARLRRLQSDLTPPSERRDVVVYVKLVTVTGGAWLLALTSELADREWLRVLAELFTCAQGVLLFWSYVCNARVWRLYRDKFLGPTKDASSSRTTHSTNVATAATASATNTPDKTNKSTVASV